MKTITVTNSCDDTVISTSEALDLSSGTDTLYLSSTSVNSDTLGVTNISITGVECIDTSASTTVITIDMSGQTEDLIVTGANKLEDTITTGAGNDTIYTGDFTGISGNVLWFDASDSSTVLDAEGDASDSGAFSGVVSTWLDKSGSGNDLTGTGATMDTIGGLDSIRFTSDIMTGVDAFGGSTEEIEIFFVMQENVRNANQFISFNGNSGTRVFFHTPWSNGDWYFDPGDVLPSSTRLQTTGAPKAVGDVTMISANSSTFDNDRNLTLDDGVTFTKTTNIANSLGTTGGLRIGQNANDQELAELIVFDRKLTDAERQEVEDYLDAKWNTGTAYTAPDLYVSDEDVFTGGAGADTFVFSANNSDKDVISDFSIAEGDVLDISDIITGFSGTITDHLEFVELAGDTYVRVDADGGADEFQIVAQLDGVTGLDEATLYANGNIIV